jgi:lauroyl/myristoyl acyltransferase
LTDLGYVLAAAAARHLPRFTSEALAIGLADLYTWTHPNRARAIERRLRRARVGGTNPKPPVTARETHRAFARGLRDFLATGWREHPRVRVDAEGRAILREARTSGRSTVLVSGHFGPWEAALQWLAHEIGSVDALARPHRLPRVERFFAARRARFGVRTLSAGSPVLAALARLRAGGWIAALADRGSGWKGRRPAGGAPSDGTDPAERLVPLDAGPLLLARRASAQVLAGVAWREPDGVIEVRFHPAFTLEPRRGGIGMAQAQATLQRFFDAHVRAHPTQWFDWGVWSPAGEGVDASRG